MMKIENDIFKKMKLNVNSLLDYGFVKDNNIYKYSKVFMNDRFRADIVILDNGTVSGKVFDLTIDDEYTNFRVEGGTGSFVGQVRDEYISVLKDIRSKCFISDNFIFEQSNKIANLIKEKYGDEPNFEWEKFPGYATFRNSNSKKWYGIIMNIDKSKLEEKSFGEVEIIDIKLEPLKIEKLLQQKGFYPAYHMNKKSWITIILDNTVSDEDIMELIEESYSYTVIGSDNKSEWIVPANPKYFDIEEAIKKSNTIIWKQSTAIKVNDIVYLYVAEPFSSIMYKFKVLEADIPYEYKDENVKMQKVMKIDLITRYEKGKLSFSKLKEFGINAVRGPRYMPLDLSKYISEIGK